MSKLVAMLSMVVASRRDDENGATAVEYGLLVALIAAFIIGAVTLVGIDVNDAFTDVANAIP